MNKANQMRILVLQRASSGQVTGWICADPAGKVFVEALEHGQWGPASLARSDELFREHQLVSRIHPCDAVIAHDGWKFVRGEFCYRLGQLYAVNVGGDKIIHVDWLLPEDAAIARGIRPVRGS